VIAALGPERAAAESAIGRRMPLNEAIAYAVADDDSNGSNHPGEHRPTGREAAVLRVVAAGYSNSDLAQELVLNVWTVERHIANIYAKIGAHGRADATAYALRHGLADKRDLHSLRHGVVDQNGY
jgi:DNA-binding NarL/FixJ family response regulator